MSPASGMRQATREWESAISALVALFPKQHPLTKAWVEGQKATEGAELPERRPSVHRTSGSANHQEPPVQRGQRGSSPARHHSKTPTAAPKSPPLPPPPPAPRFEGNKDEWGKDRPGTHISFDDEERLRDTIKGKLGIANASSGFSTNLLPIMYSQSVGHGQEISVEILIPRRQKFDAVLVGIGKRGDPKTDYFEVPLARIGPALIHNLGIYVLNHGLRP